MLGVGSVIKSWGGGWWGGRKAVEHNPHAFFVGQFWEVTANEWDLVFMKYLCVRYGGKSDIGTLMTNSMSGNPLGSL